jgi:PEP-CTERM motif
MLMNRLVATLLIFSISPSCLPALAGPLAMDTTAMAGFHGTTHFQGFDLSNNPTGLTGTVDYAVWAPGTFPGAFAGFSASDYVYAYQVHETGTALLSSFSVALSAPADRLNIGNFTGNNGFGLVSGDASDPNSTFIVPLDSADWFFDGVVQGGTTDGLAFSSPNAPFSYYGYYGATVMDDSNAVAFVIPLPTPIFDEIPEPGTFMLAALGFISVAAWGWRRRR